MEKLIARMMPEIAATQICSAEKLRLTPTGDNRAAINKARSVAIAMKVIVVVAWNR